MNTIKRSKLKNLFSDYCNQKKFTKPLLLWFANHDTLYGVEKSLVKDQSLSTIRIMGNPMDEHCMVYIGDDMVSEMRFHPELMPKDGLPIGYNDETARIVYYTEKQRLKKSNLDYCIHVLNSCQKPVICCVNDSDIDEVGAVNREYINNNFEQFFVIERTADEWLEWIRQWRVSTDKEGNKKIFCFIESIELMQYLSLILYTKPEWFIKSAAYIGMPEEAVHTREQYLTNLVHLIYTLKHRECDEVGFHENSSQKIEKVMDYVEGTDLKDLITSKKRFQSILEKYFDLK